MLEDSVVIVGAGHAGQALAVQLRTLGHDGSIALLSEESIAPYQRPPLSKAWLMGELADDELAFRPSDFYESQRIDVRLGARAVSVNRDERNVALADGARISYRYLVLATGARPLIPPIAGCEVDGVLSLRTADDATRIRAAIEGGGVVVVGGGYLGLEISATARMLGRNVTVLERESRLLARVASRTLSTYYERLHRAHGVEIVTSAEVVGITADADGRASAVHLANGDEHRCDTVIVSTGVRPNDELARDAGLPCTDGIVVDDDGRTSDPAIFALGDVAWRTLPRYGHAVRLESVPSAVAMAKRAAAAICGAPSDDNPFTPWFWSNQYDVKLQIAGLPIDVDEQVVLGSIDDSRFSVLHLSGETVQCIEAVNSPRDFVTGRQLIGRRTPVNAGRLDDDTPLSEFASDRRPSGAPHDPRSAA